ncbi:MAG: FAD-binding oxidoreductase [Pseudomonadota bacterium]
MTYQSPISPGLSWYEASVGERPEYPQFNGDQSCDVAIIGGGFTGLGAAAHLAKAGVSVVLLEAYRFGDGASGRNGGQLNTGQRAGADDHEGKLGFERAKALFDLAEEAKHHLLDFAKSNSIEIDYKKGHMSVTHKQRYVKDFQEYPSVMAERFGYEHLRFLDKAETAERMGSSFYQGGCYDSETGHIHPLKLVVGTARVAAKNGAHLHENSPVTAIRHENGKTRIETKSGTVTADRVLLAVNAYGSEKLEPVMASHVMPIQSFIGATVPLGDDVLPNGESVDDTRFMVRYFRKTNDGRLLFGGREAYTADTPDNIAELIRNQIAEIYPALKNVEITHAWGGSVGITMPREPFVRDVMPGVTAIGGYSGHGVMLSNFTGRLYAEAVTGNRDRLKLFRDLDIPAFPGGRRFRKPLLTAALTWYSMLDKI